MSQMFKDLRDSFKEWSISVPKRWWEMLGVPLTIIPLCVGIISFIRWTQNSTPPLPWWIIGLVVGGAILFFVVSFATFHKLRMEVKRVRSEQDTELKLGKDDDFPSISETIKNSKVVWGFWHTGNRARESFYYGSVKRILLLEPDPNSEAFRHVLSEVSIRPVTAKELIAQIELTKDEAISKNIKIRWHNEVTSHSLMICDPSAEIEGGKTTFSDQAFVFVQVPDRNLNIEEWKKYKKTASRDRGAFDRYVAWFKDVWDNKSKPVSS